MERKLAEILHVNRGDWIVIKPVKGLRHPHRIQVVEISDSFLGTSVYADIDYLSRLIGEETAVSGVQLLIDRNPEHIEAFYREVKRLPAIQAVNSREDMVQNLNKTFLDLMWVFIGILIVFAGVMFFGSILNASLVSLAERQREIATLRVLGYGRWQIGSLLLRESLIVTLAGTVLGMPLGYLLAVATSWAYDTEMFRFPVVSSAGTWIWTVVLAVLFALTAHLIVQRNIHKMDWLEALKVQE
jgi:putative ABC transport system permease protein